MHGPRIAAAMPALRPVPLRLLLIVSGSAAASYDVDAATMHMEVRVSENNP